MKRQILRNKASYQSLASAVAIAGLLLVLSSGDSSAGKAAISPRDESRAIARTETLLAGIPQHGSVLGRPTAPVTLQFFGDLQCSESRQVMLGALPFLIRHWVREGKLRILFRSLQTDTRDRSEFIAQQTAAAEAGREERMWTFIDLFYREQQAEFTYYADEAFLIGIAEQAGVDTKRWAENRDSVALVEQIESDQVLAAAKTMESTPSFLIGPTNGAAHRLLHFSLEEPTVFDKAIRGLL
jgi:protein-disulfide isomerase